MAFAFQTPLIGKMGEIAVCRQWIFLFFWNVLNFINIHIPDKERSACRSEAGGVWATRALHSKNLINTSANSRWETFIVVSFFYWTSTFQTKQLKRAFGQLPAFAYKQVRHSIRKLSVWVLATLEQVLKTLSVSRCFKLGGLETLSVPETYNANAWNSRCIKCLKPEVQVLEVKSFPGKLRREWAGSDQEKKI